jgi:hypothetical protein
MEEISRISHFEMDKNEFLDTRLPPKPRLDTIQNTIPVPDLVSTMSLSESIQTDDIPNLELLLKKLLLSKKRKSKTDTKPFDSVLEFEKDYFDLKKESINVPTNINQEPKSTTKEASTSPASKHTRKELIKRYKNKTKSNVSSCTCPTFSSHISWVCPGCLSNATHSIPIAPSKSKSILEPNKTNPILPLASKDKSILFANETSMIKPLSEIIAELEMETECTDPDLEDLEVISSLNGV